MTTDERKAMKRILPLTLLLLSCLSAFASTSYTDSYSAPGFGCGLQAGLNCDGLGLYQNGVFDGTYWVSASVNGTGFVQFTNTSGLPVSVQENPLATVNGFSCNTMANFTEPSGKVDSLCVVMTVNFYNGTNYSGFLTAHLNYTWASGHGWYQYVTAEALTIR